MSTTTTTKLIDPTEIQQMEHNLRARADREIDALREQRERELHRRHPLHSLLEDRRLLSERIARGERDIIVHRARAEIFRSRLDEAFSHESGSLLCYPIFAKDPMETHAERLASELDRWLAERRTDLAALDGRVVALARELRLESLLPDGLANSK